MHQMGRKKKAIKGGTKSDSVQSEAHDLDSAQLREKHASTSEKQHATSSLPDDRFMIIENTTKEVNYWSYGILSKEIAKAFVKSVKRYGTYRKMDLIAAEVGDIIQEAPDGARNELFYALVDQCRACADDGRLDPKSTRVDFFGVIVKAHDFFDRIYELQILAKKVKRCEMQGLEFTLESDFVGEATEFELSKEDYCQILLGINIHGFGNWEKIVSSRGLQTKIAKEMYPLLKPVASKLLYKEFTDLEGRDIDWRKMGFVTPSIDQGDCGCCWAFCSCGIGESREAIEEGDISMLKVLSPGCLVDCDRSMKQRGCLDGDLGSGLAFMTWNDVFELKGYKYKYATCSEKFDRERCRSSEVASKGFKPFRVGAAFVAKYPSRKRFLQELFQGPFGANMDAFNFDRNITYAPNLVWRTQRPNPELQNSDTQAILVTGAGRLKGKPFCHAKNSWGPTFADNGFFYDRSGGMWY